MIRSFSLALCAAGLLALAGCSKSEAEVSGTVLIDGAALKEGDILFEEVDKSKTPSAGKVIDGKYSVKMVPGNKVVRITASRPARKPDPVMGSAAREPLIRAEFNEKSTLKIEIAAGRREDLNFDVKAIP